MKEVDTRTPNWAHGLFAVLGAGLIIVGYFLPTYYVPNADASSPSGPADYHMASMWDGIYATLGGTTTFNPQTNEYAASQLHIFLFVVDLAPMVMAALILVLGIWAFFKGPGSGRRAAFSAALVVVALSLVSSLSSALSISYEYSGNGAPSDPLVALGSAIVLLGVFFALVSGFLIQRR